MFALNDTMKSLVCGIAAITATLIMSWSVVHATATYSWGAEPESSRAVVAKAAPQGRHQWFGQPAPAVLVD